jgi:hypothetical protein
MIKVRAGPEGVKYSIPEPVRPMREHRAYNLCEGGICGEPHR